MHRALSTEDCYCSATVIFKFRATNAHSSAVSSMILEIGFPAPCPALVSNSNQHRRRPRLVRLHGRGKFEAVPRHNPVVMIRRSDQRRRIFRPRFQIMQRRIRIQSLEVLGDCRTIRNPTSTPTRS